MPWSGARQLLNAHQARPVYVKGPGYVANVLRQAVELLHLQAIAFSIPCNLLIDLRISR
jgi:hypothetical protein